MTSLTPRDIYDLLNRPKPLWLVGIDLSETNLRAAGFSQAKLIDANLYRANLFDANLEEEN